MYPCLVVAALVLVALTATIKTEESVEDIIQKTICSEDEEMRSAVLDCISLMSKEHVDVVRKCVPGCEDVGDDWPEKLIEKQCQGEKAPVNYFECGKEVYEEKGISIEEAVGPGVECLGAIFEKAAKSEDKK